MLEDIYKGKTHSELIEEIHRLRSEVLGWHHTATTFESQVRQLIIERDALKDANQRLAIENVKLLNKADPQKVRHYADNLISNEQPVQSHV